MLSTSAGERGSKPIVDLDAGVYLKTLEIHTDFLLVYVTHSLTVSPQHWVSYVSTPYLGGGS